MKERESLCKVLTNFILSSSKAVSSIFKKELIDTGRMSNITVQNILSGNLNVDELDISALIWIYRAISKYKSMPDITRYFEELEIKRAEVEKEKALQSKPSLIFDAIPLLQKEQYLLHLDIKEINSLQASGIIKIIENMQRESEVTAYKGQLITHVAYKDGKAREIASSILERNYWTDTIRFHLINNEDMDYVYDPVNKQITINRGSIALLDGQHRVRAMEYALIQEPSLQYDWPVILSIGTVRDGQNIISQHEKQEPINKHVVKTYQKTIANEVFRKFETNDEIISIYKFTDTIQKLNAGAGFVLKSDMISAINKYYNVEKFSLKEQSILVRWMVEFFMEVAIYFEDDMKNYIKNTRWNTNRHIFPALVWLSREIQGKDCWKETLTSILDDTDFENRLWKVGATRPDAFIIKHFKQGVEKYGCS